MDCRPGCGAQPDGGRHAQLYLSRLEQLTAPA